jgi:hypothetical protein
MRSLDYLPPGEISFADFGRAIIAADWSSNPDTDAFRVRIAEEFVSRHIAASADDLLRKPAMVGTRLADVDLETLLKSDWSAYQFVEANRNRLGIPSAIPFRVLPRLAVEKTTWRKHGGRASYRELILKVEWEREEPNDIMSLFASTRAITAGLTLAIDRDDSTVKALLITDDDNQQAKDRSDFLRNLVEEELITTDSGERVSSGIKARISSDVLRVKGGARSLHLTAAVH